MDLLTTVIQQLARFEPLGDLEERARELLGTLVTSVDDEKRRLDERLVRVLMLDELLRLQNEGVVTSITSIRR